MTPSDGQYGSDDPFELERFVRARLELMYPGDVLELFITRTHGGLLLGGQVASEDARSAAIRILIAATSIKTIVNEIEVTGFFFPASQEWDFDDDPSDRIPFPPDASPSYGPAFKTNKVDSMSTEPPATEPEVISRFPHIEINDELVAATKIEIRIDLREEPSEASDEAINIATLPPGWQKLSIAVTLISADLMKINSNQACITVFEGGGSQQAVFSAVLRDDLKQGDVVSLQAIFSLNGRFCGISDAVLGKVIGQKNDARAKMAIFFASKAVPPSLTIHINPIKDQLHWTWQLGPGVEANAGTTFEQVEIPDRAQFLDELLKACPTMGANDFRRRMHAIGEKIWAHTPPGFQALYLDLRSRHGATFPIQFITGEFHVPWELMRPEGDGFEHLFLTHPVARWPSAQGTGLRQILPRGSIESFVPNYSSGTLPAAIKESQWVVSTLSAIARTATKQNFIDLMQCKGASKTIGILHFAGHGKASNGLRDSGIRLSDDWVLIDDIDNSQTKLGQRDRSIVVLNACETGAGNTQLGWFEGWAPMLARRGFSAIIAPLWRVQDNAALSLMQSGLTHLVTSGGTLGESFTNARASISNDSVASFAFMTYGDVMATIA
jgi:hypothetical protein